MKKILSIAVLGICTLSLFSCSKNKKIEYIDDFELSLVSDSEGSTSYEPVITTQKQYEFFKDSSINTTTITSNESDYSKLETYTFFGKECSLNYTNTIKQLYPIERIIDLSFPLNQDTGYSVRGAWIDRTTKKCLYYYIVHDNSEEGDINYKEYTSSVNPKSTEEDFVLYAKDLFESQQDISLDGWDYDVRTSVIPSHYLRGILDKDHQNGWETYIKPVLEYYDPSGVNPKMGFLSNTQVDYYRTSYTLQFYKKIDGIRRNDEVCITVTNFGQPVLYRDFMYDEAYKPYENIDLDNEKIDKLITERADHNTPANSTYTVDKYLVPIDDVLYVYATVSYIYTNELGSEKSGIMQYRMPVAKLVS